MLGDPAADPPAQPAASGPDQVDALAARVVAGLAGARLTVATAESLTAGLVAARIADVPGASRVLRGGVVAYATDVKSSVLGVPAALLAEQGPVHPQVATAMAAGARDRLGADVGVATTGVAGPDPQGGVPVGTVLLAVVTRDGAWGRRLDPAAAWPGRAAVRAASVRAALHLLVEVLAEHPSSTGS